MGYECYSSLLPQAIINVSQDSLHVSSPSISFILILHRFPRLEIPGTPFSFSFVCNSLSSLQVHLIFFTKSLKENAEDPSSHQIYRLHERSLSLHRFPRLKILDMTPFLFLLPLLLSLLFISLSLFLFIIHLH